MATVSNTAEKCLWVTDFVATGLAEGYRESGGPLGCTLTDSDILDTFWHFGPSFCPSSHEKNIEK